MMRHVFEMLYGRDLRRETRRYLAELSSAPARASRQRLLDSLESSSGTSDGFCIGTAQWGDGITMPLEDVTRAHSLVTGGTGSGKTRFALNIVRHLLDRMPDLDTQGLGVIDPKGDLFIGALLLLWERLSGLEKTQPDAAERLRRRVVIVDFGSRDPVSSYNVLARWPNADPDFFAGSRADLLLDLLPGGDGLSLGASAVLRKMIILLSEFDLPITWLDRLIHDAGLRDSLVGRSASIDTKTYFARQFPTTPKQSLGAVSRRMEALFASEGVRMSLSGTTVPDFRELQDGGFIVLVNCFGQNMSRSVRQLMQSLVLSDVAHSVFTRRKKDASFLWLCDEAQNFFANERLRDHAHDLLTMSRSFGTFLCCLTQNIGAAVQDQRLLHSLFTNIRWSMSMRGEPGDAAFLREALPITGQRLQVQSDPFRDRAFLSANEERNTVLNGLAHLPDREGYFWFRPKSKEAVRMTAQTVYLPMGYQADCILDRIQREPSLGRRLGRTDYEQEVSARDDRWRTEPEEPVPAADWTDAYARLRKGAA